MGQDIVPPEGGQDRKFKFENGQFVNRVSGEPIPLDEPIMIFRARDHHALETIKHYYHLIQDDHHRQAVADRLDEFDDFSRKNPDRMKEPGITRQVSLNKDQ